MTKRVLDALLAYIDARIEERMSSHIQDAVHALDLREELVRAVAAEKEVEG